MSIKLYSDCAVIYYRRAIDRAGKIAIEAQLKGQHGISFVFFRMVNA